MSGSGEKIGRLLMAGSTQWGTRHIAAIEKFVVSANVGFLAQGPTHPIGQLQTFVVR